MERVWLVDVAGGSISFTVHDHTYLHLVCMDVCHDRRREDSPCETDNRDDGYGMGLVVLRAWQG